MLPDSRWGIFVIMTDNEREARLTDLEELMFQGLQILGDLESAMKSLMKTYFDLQSDYQR